MKNKIIQLIKGVGIAFVLILAMEYILKFGISDLSFKNFTTIVPPVFRTILMVFGIFLIFILLFSGKQKK